jgi:hypothetical protein
MVAEFGEGGRLTPVIVLVHELPRGLIRGTTALPPKAAAALADRGVRFGPVSDVGTDATGLRGYPTSTSHKCAAQQLSKSGLELLVFLDRRGTDRAQAVYWTLGRSGDLSFRRRIFCARVANGFVAQSKERNLFVHSHGVFFQELSRRGVLFDQRGVLVGSLVHPRERFVDLFDAAGVLDTSAGSMMYGVWQKWRIATPI